MTAEDQRPADGMQRYAELATGLTRTTLGVTERALAHFVRQGEVAAEHAERVVEEVIARSIEGSGALARLVRSEVERTAERAGFVRASDLADLRDEVRTLRAQVAAQAARASDVRSAPPAAPSDPEPAP